MAKRTYSPENGRLFQYKVDGNFYMRMSDTEICLETNDIDQAIENLKVQDALTKRFGTKAFQKKVGVLFPEFLKKKKKDVRLSTFKLYEGIWRTYFLPSRLPKLYLADVNQKSWTAFCEKNASVKDFQNHRNLMHQFLLWCESNEWITAVPTLKNPKHKRRKRRIIPPEHLKIIFQYANGSLLLFLSMALFQGMRRSEVMKLSWLRVDLPTKSLLLGDEDVKTNDGRHIPLNSTVYQLLLNRLKTQQYETIKTPWVFPHANNPKKHASLTGLMTAWRTCLLHCGLADKVFTTGNKSKYKIVVQYTWHDLRATFEKYSHKSKDYTDTQKEKMVGADIDVQKRIYVSMDADDLRGLEEVVSIQVPELAQIVSRKTNALKVEPGNELGNDLLTNSDGEVSDEN